MIEDSEIVFLRTYKDFIYYFNMLESNMAYCLRYCFRVKQENNSVEKWHKASFDQKLKKISMIAKKNIPKEQYETLFQKLGECRQLRNVVVHGHWEWKDFLDEPIHYHAPEPFNKNGSLTVKAFQEHLSFLKETFQFFMDLRPAIEAQ